MLFSFNKLKELASLTPETTVNDVVNAINSIGFEVEEFNKFTNVEGIKFGKILEIYKNPNADKLNVCKIQFDDQERTIQTNATNVEEGMTVIAFVPGSKLGDVTFGAKELKGIMSEGMLSAPSEFGIDKDLFRPEIVEGITRYDEVTDLSIDPIEYLGLNDYIIDVSILSNRSDAASYYIMALELAAYFKTNAEVPVYKQPNMATDMKVENGSAHSLVAIEGKKTFNLTVKDQIFLAKSKVKSINDIVDLTNITLLMTGQPTHAYDKANISNNIKAADYSGTVNVFGNKEVELKDDLVIMSDDKPVSVAGVIGLEETGVSNSTNEFVIELGRFNINKVRKAVKSVKLNTAASSQSSKNLSIGTTEYAIAFLSNVLKDFSLPVNYAKEEVKVVKYDKKQTSMVAGFNIYDDPRMEEVIKSLSILGFKFDENQVVVPNYRHDIESQQDIDEEIFRFYGYNNFQLTKPKLNPSSISTIETLHEKISAQGYKEVVTYSLISEERNTFNPFGFNETVKLETFVSKEREVIRNSQLMSLLEVLDYNTKRKMENISIFDMGMVNDGFKTYALATTQKDFNEVKEDIANLISDEITFERFEDKHLHPGASAKIMLNGEMIGYIAKPHPSLTDINAVFAEFKTLQGNSKVNYHDYSKDPLKTRDITFELIDNAELDSKISQIRNMNVFDIKVIDEFKKENINKVTIRIYASEDVIETIDKEYNQ